MKRMLWPRKTLPRTSPVLLEYRTVGGGSWRKDGPYDRADEGRGADDARASISSRSSMPENNKWKYEFMCHVKILSP